MAAETNPNHDQGPSITISVLRPIEEEEEEEDQEVKGMATPDLRSAAMKIERSKEVHSTDTEIQEKPTKIEIWVWYLYGLCSHFVLTTLVPIVFPLIISQIFNFPEEAAEGWGETPRAIPCRNWQIELYKRLTQRKISVGSLKFSTMEWTTISWVIGIILASPFAGLISNHLDYGCNQQLVAAAATAIGSLFCLPVGFFRTPRVFPLYIAAIISSYIVATASHTRHLGLIIRGFTGPTPLNSQYHVRRGVSGWFSTYDTAAGCLGSAIISAFTYHMLRNKKDPFVSLWIVSIFSGLKWLVGILHVVSVRTVAISTTHSVPQTHFLTFFKHPHAIGSLIVVFLSSFTSMCIFNGGLLYLLGQLCFKSLFFLYFWLVYFIFPSFSLPLLQPLQHAIKADSLKMQLLGFLLALLASGMGFYYKEKNWHRHHVLIFAAIQSTSAGLLHAFGRVLLLDCTPHGKEGAFSVWFSWVKALGTCAGFAVASAVPGNIGSAFGVSFSAATIGLIILIFGNISDIGGPKAAGYLHRGSERGSPVRDLDSSFVMKESVHVHEETD